MFDYRYASGNQGSSRSERRETAYVLHHHPDHADPEADMTAPPNPNAGLAPADHPTRPSPALVAPQSLTSARVSSSFWSPSLCVWASRSHPTPSRLQDSSQGSSVVSSSGSCRRATCRSVVPLPV